MGDQKEEDLYLKFSRKYLQGLCKKYGLPANKSNSEMATSLILFLEKKNLSTRAIWEGARSDLFASGTLELQTFVRMSSTEDLRKECESMAFHRGSGNNQHHNHQEQPNDLQNCKVSASSDKASVDVGTLMQLQRESTSGAGVPENTFSSVVSSPVVAPAPTFTFDVSCEDGIQLYVDLNSSPSDWIESLKSGVHINHVVKKPKSQSFHEDIGLLTCLKKKNGSITIDPSKETDKGQFQDGSYPTTIFTDNLAETDEPDEEEGSLTSPGSKSLSNAVHSLGNSKDEQGYLSSRLESGTEGKLPGTKSSRSEEIFAESDLNALVQSRSCCNFTGNFVPSDPKCLGMPAHQGANAGNGIFIKPPLQQTSCPLDPVLKCSESSTTVCMEMQASTCATTNKDIEYSLCGNGGCLIGADPLKKNEMVQSGIVESILTPSRDELQMWPAQAVDQSTCVSPVVNCLPLDLADNKSKVIEDNRTFDRKFERQIREAQSYFAGSHSKNRYFPPGQRFVSQDVIDLTSDIETENVGFLRTQEAGSETDELPHKDAALNPCCNDGSLELAVPTKNRVDHGISTKSNDLIEDICGSPSTTNGQSDCGNGREGSECLNSSNLMEKPWKKPSDPESTGAHKRKRNLDSIVHQSKSVNHEAKILRSSKWFDGDGHSKRRRSLRLFNK